MPSTATTTTTPAFVGDSHILVFPYPAQGHMLPLLDLTHQLALHGLNITILITPKNLLTLTQLLSTHPHSIRTLILPFPTHPKVPFGVENVKDIGYHGVPPMTEALTMLEGEFLQWFKAHPHPPEAMISDFFLGFTNHWARKLNIRRVAFHPSGAFAISVLVHLLQNLDTFRNLGVLDFKSLPRSPSFTKDYAPSLYKLLEKDDKDWNIMNESLLENWRSWAIVFNSFYALEGEYLDHIKKEIGHERVYGVGPSSSAGLRRANSDANVCHGVLNWLDKCQDGHVLYVCFGSQKQLSKPQVQALALGLERCKTQFVWVVNSGISKLLPIGFEERVKDTGLVVHRWAPQVEILNHKAVGGFLSHCGWNSTLESIMAGVMVLGWPMENDQLVNAKLLIEYMGSAVWLCHGEDTVPNPDELARIIHESLGRRILQQERAKLLKKKALEAVKPSGSSFNDLDELVKQLRGL